MIIVFVNSSHKFTVHVYYVTTYKCSLSLLLAHCYCSLYFSLSTAQDPHCTASTYCPCKVKIHTALSIYTCPPTEYTHLDQCTCSPCNFMLMVFLYVQLQSHNIWLCMHVCIHSTVLSLSVCVCQVRCFTRLHVQKFTFVIQIMCCTSLYVYMTLCVYDYDY